MERDMHTYHDLWSSIPAPPPDDGVVKPAWLQGWIGAGLLMTWQTNHPTGLSAVTLTLISMHPLTDNPVYAPCNSIIQQYEQCNSSLWNRYTNKCSILYEQMCKCMKDQVRIPVLYIYIYLYITLTRNTWLLHTPAVEEERWESRESQVSKSRAGTHASRTLPGYLDRIYGYNIMEYK